MPIYNRKEIAKAHLHRAIVLFVEENDYINAITLSGAAEEVLGRFAEKLNREHAMEQLVNNLHEKIEERIDKKIIRDVYLNKAKNSLKHFDDGDDEMLEIKHPEGEARNMICRAIINLVIVEGQLSEHAKCFFDYDEKKRPDLYKKPD